MTAPRLLPLVAVCADVKRIGDQDYHAAGDKYVRAAAVASGVQPLVLPALSELGDPATLVERLDGLLLTGSPSNIHPARYHAPDSHGVEPYDTARDATVLALIGPALAAGLPFLGLCRGLHELNVALGGTLHPRLHEVAGREDHRAPPDAPLAVRYGPRHRIRIEPGSRLHAIAGLDEALVNSVHGQGVDRLAPGLEVEARAPDGTIEAVRVRDAPGFALAVQWHPEYEASGNELSRRLFAAFGDACRARAAACMP